MGGAVQAGAYRAADWADVWKRFLNQKIHLLSHCDRRPAQPRQPAEYLSASISIHRHIGEINLYPNTLHFI